jgi:hypothetical protein
MPIGDGPYLEVGIDPAPDPHELAAFFKGPSEVGHRGVGHGAALVSFKRI